MALESIEAGLGGILDNLTLSYEPFPVGVSRPAFPASTYEALVDTWPPQEAFAYKPELGHKFSLSEVNNTDRYHAFLEAAPPWSDFHAFVKARTFIPMVIGTLRRHGVDLGLDAQPAGYIGRARRYKRDAIRWATGCGVPRLSARFEFSMLPADGGSIKPHTDDPRKLVTLVLSMSRDDDWDSQFGGSTDILRPIDTRKSFNQLNRQLEFDEVEKIASYPFEPNQCLIFVKTFNSLHSVGPMTGHDTPAMRRTLTINIENKRA